MTWDKLEEFISKNKTVILAITCVLLFAYIFLLKPTIVTVTDPASLKELESYKDKNGKLYAQIVQDQVDKSQMRKYADSLADALKIKKTSVKTIEKVTIATDTLFYQLPSIPIVRYNSKDTAYQIEKHDPWVDIVAVAGKDSGSIKYSSRDTLTRVETVKNPLFGKSTRKVYLNSSNPYNHIEEGYSFTIKERTVLFTVGPSIQYDPFSKKVSVGISVQKPILKVRGRR